MLINPLIAKIFAMSEFKNIFVYIFFRYQENQRLVTVTEAHEDTLLLGKALNKGNTKSKKGKYILL